MIQENISMILVVTTGNYSFHQQIVTGIVYTPATITVFGEFIVYWKNQHIEQDYEWY